MPRAMTPEEKKEATLVRSDNERPRGDRVRSAFNGTTQKLTVAREIPGYKLYGFNDEGNRIQTALSAGWEFVTPEEVGGVGERVTSNNTDIGDKVRFLVGTSEKGGGLYTYIMKIREDWYKEDQDTAQQKNDIVDDAIRSGTNTPSGSSSEGFYTPREGIKYQTK